MAFGAIIVFHTWGTDYAFFLNWVVAISGATLTTVWATACPIVWSSDTIARVHAR